MEIPEFDIRDLDSIVSHGEIIYPELKDVYIKYPFLNNYLTSEQLFNPLVCKIYKDSGIYDNLTIKIEEYYKIDNFTNYVLAIGMIVYKILKLRDTYKECVILTLEDFDKIFTKYTCEEILANLNKIKH